MLGYREHRSLVGRRRGGQSRRKVTLMNGLFAEAYAIERRLVALLLRK
jgi:hypothetical protein